MFESWSPPTLKPGIPRSQNAAASSSVESSSDSAAVPAGCTGEYVDWSEEVYAGTCGVGTAGSGAEPVWLYRSGFSCGTVPPYLAACCAKPLVTALCRSVLNCEIAALLAEMSAPGEPGPVSG